MPRKPEKKKLSKKTVIILIIAAALVLIGAVIGVIAAVNGSRQLPDLYAYYKTAPSQMTKIKNFLVYEANEKQALKIFIYSDDTYQTEGAGRRVLYTYLDEDGTEMITSYGSYTDFFTSDEASQLRQLFNSTLLSDIYLEFTTSGDLRVDFNESTNKYGYHMALSYLGQEPEDANQYYGTLGSLVQREMGDQWYYLRRLIAG